MCYKINLINGVKGNVKKINCYKSCKKHKELKSENQC